MRSPCGSGWELPLVSRLRATANISRFQTYLSLKDEQAEAMNRLMHQRRIKQQQEMMREE